MKEVVLLRVCRGMNDSGSFNAPEINVETGEAEIIDCKNVTTTPDGRVETTPGYATIVTPADPILAISAGDKFLVQTEGTLSKLLGTTLTTLDSSTALENTAAFVNTLIDTRFNLPDGSKYKIKNGVDTITELGVGQYSGPPTSITYYGMPVFTSAFVHNSKLYAAYGSFLQYSSGYGYDLWNLADDFIPCYKTIWQAGAIPGCVVTTHSDGIIVYSGSGPANFAKRFYPCPVINRTLWSGLVSRVIGHLHVFLAENGLYIVTPDGQVKNLTEESMDNIKALNTSYTATTMADGKYIAYGNNTAIDYSFKTKAFMKRDANGIIATTLKDGIPFFASASKVLSLDETNFSHESSITLPFSDLSAPQAKRFHCLYLTGEFKGALTITVSNQRGDSVSVDAPKLGLVHQYRVNGISPCIGTNLSVKIKCKSGYMRIEELRGVYIPTAGR
jgi:hypothetical protein